MYVKLQNPKERDPQMHKRIKYRVGWYTVDPLSSVSLCRKTNIHWYFPTFLFRNISPFSITPSAF